MNKFKTIDIIKQTLDNIDFNDKKEIVVKQLVTCIDLIDALAIDLVGVGGSGDSCKHEDEQLINISVLGSNERKFQCLACGEVIIK